MAVVRLTKWSVVERDETGYTPPEMRVKRLQGIVSGDARRKDGTIVTTTRIVSSSGRTVKTKSGTVYILGKIDPGYRAFLRKQEIPYDSANPVKIR